MGNCVYDDGVVTLIQGNSVEIMSQLGPIDLVLTDPPYGETSLEWDRWPYNWPNRARDICRQLWCFGSARLFMEHHSEFEFWHFAQDVVWEKHNGSGLHTDRFRRVHELIFHFYHGKWEDLHHEVPVTMDATKRRVKRANKPAHWGSLKSHGTYSAEDGGPRLMRSVIFAPSMHGNALHPTQKPIEILAPLIEYSTEPGDVILDPFAGSGSTLVAAKQLGRRAIGIEVNADYIATAVKRLSQTELFTAEKEKEKC